jgi:phosphoribosyl-AMP cyclohydrolase
MQFMFKKRDNIKDVEEGKYLSPKFDENGLIPVVTTDFRTGELLMHGYMNDKALKKTIETKEAYYWSRSRKNIWHKGQVSGFIQKVKEIRIDDDQDSVWLSVDIGSGSSCHVGYRSCFYRSIPLGKIKDEEKLEIEFKETEKTFDPKKIYKDEPNPTKL